jgi:hypothetical protein
MLKRASRETPPIKKRKQMNDPACTRFSCSCGFIASERKWKPQISASRLGATPKVIASASESSSLPKSLHVFVMRAMRPSRESIGMAIRIAIAAQSRCTRTSPTPVSAAIVCMIEKKPAAILPTVKSDGSRNIPRRIRACARALASAGSRGFINALL